MRGQPMISYAGPMSCPSLVLVSLVSPVKSRAALVGDAPRVSRRNLVTGAKRAAQHLHRKPV